MTTRSLFAVIPFSLTLLAVGCAPSSGGSQTPAATRDAQAAAAQPSTAQETPSETPTVTKEQARATALGQVPQGQVESEELEREGGHLVYSFDISVPGQAGIEEVLVDAMDGTIVSAKHESPAAEQAEAKADQAAANAGGH